MSALDAAVQALREAERGLNSLDSYDHAEQIAGLALALGFVIRAVRHLVPTPAAPASAPGWVWLPDSEEALHLATVARVQYLYEGRMALFFTHGETPALPHVAGQINTSQIELDAVDAAAVRAALGLPAPADAAPG